MDITPLSTPASASRKRERENETPSQRHKREKAAERQRRKRERDRNANHSSNTHLTPTTPASNGVLFSIPPNEHSSQESPDYAQAQRQGEDSLLSPEELARREKVRKAARERQRKHRALVKDRKMRELGLDMGNEISEVPYHSGHVQVNADSHHYHQPSLGHNEIGHHSHAHVGGEPPPQGQVQGGQMFASTLLLSFSCAPLLKQHLLSTLSMTSEELASLEPIIAEAWDHWDQQRRAHYAQQAAPAGGPSSSSYRHDVPEPSSFPNGASNTSASVSDFRSRFQRSIVAPSPFRTSTTFTAASDTTGSNSSNSTSVSDKGGRKIDSRDTDEAVVGRLERVS